MDHRIHWDDIQEEEVQDVQAYSVDDCSDHLVHHSDSVDHDEARVAFGDNDADADLGSDPEDLQGFHCSRDEAHEDEGMEQVVVVLFLLRAYHDG
jgi:hypothetical protein